MFQGLKAQKWVLLMVVWLILLPACSQKEQTLTLATTTSTYDSGLLDALLPAFEEAHNATVEVIAVGTGQAIALGEAGDADVILVHARSREDAFVAKGFGVNRQAVMYNDFVVLGPVGDPAGIANLPLSEALSQIAATEAVFISRGDDSGTHIREQALWEMVGIDPVGIDPAGQAWYQSIGQGMGATLTVAEEEQAYTLSDRGTYLARLPEGLSLTVLVEGDENLFNPYGVIGVNPALHPTVEAELAEAFITWLLAADTQAAINAYRVSGEQLFFGMAGGDEQGGGEVEPAGRELAVWQAAGRLIFSGDLALWEVVALSLGVSGSALLLAGVMGIPAGAWLGLNQFRGQRWLTASIYTGMGFPPVVIGLLVYLLLSRQGALGSLDWLFTPPAMILAQTILALPLIIGVTMTAVRGVSGELRLQLRALGATQWQIVRTVLHEARFGVIVGLVAGFGAAISEVGAVMLVGGNIDGRTRVLTTAIVLETRRGNFELALALGIILLGLAFLANVSAVWLQRG